MDNKTIAARVKSDVASSRLDKEALIIWRAAVYSFLADNLNDGEFLIDDSIANPIEAIVVIIALEPVEKPRFHSPKKSDDASHEKLWRKKLIASSFPGSGSGPRGRERLLNSCCLERRAV